MGISKRDYRIVSSKPNHLELFSPLATRSNTLYVEKILQGEVKATMNLLDNKVKIIAGSQYKNTTLSADGIDEYDYPEVWKEKESNISPFAQIEFRSNTYTLFISGIRYDRYKTADKKMTSTNPNFGFSIFPFANTSYDDTTLWASYSSSFKTPSANERFMPDYLGGNPNLNPEKSKAYEFGIKQRLSSWGKIEASYFNTKYKDMIRLLDLGGGFWLFKNEDEAKHKGIEISSEFYPTDYLTLYLAYTKSNKKDSKSSKRLYGQADSSLKYGFIISGIESIEPLSISLLARQQRDFKTQEGEIHPANNKTLVDFKLSYYVKKAKFSFEPYLAILNLTNTTSYSYNNNPYILEKRSYSLGTNLKYEF